MRLKPIKPGMVIHCKNDMEYEQLNAEVIKLGYGSLPCKDRVNQHIVRNFVFCIEIDGVGWEYKNEVAGEITEFSDLILPELSAEEVLKICNEICSSVKCQSCPMKGNYYAGGAQDVAEIIKICEQWKADHEKKEPEVETEWFWQGTIYKIDEDGSILQFSHGEGIYDTGCEYRESAEEYMADELKEFCKEHEGNFIAVVEHVCRVRQ